MSSIEDLTERYDRICSDRSKLQTQIQHFLSNLPADRILYLGNQKEGESVFQMWEVTGVKIRLVMMGDYLIVYPRNDWMKRVSIAWNKGQDDLREKLILVKKIDLELGRIDDLHKVLIALMKGENEKA